MLAESHLSRHVQQSAKARIGTFIFRDSLDTSLLNLELSCQTLCLCIEAISICEGFPRNGSILRDI
ncbi:hypothetical protein AAFC00_006469 [Neodothiora populina]|uniref:Uncharacterized protein n=1 Tax=Neodothiora populina TaxID=2781224 RepID=A0ABR3P5N2_9PEZI